MRWMLLMLVVSCAGCVAVPRVRVTMATERGDVEAAVELEL